MSDFKEGQLSPVFFTAEENEQEQVLQANGQNGALGNVALAGANPVEQETAVADMSSKEAKQIVKGLPQPLRKVIELMPLIHVHSEIGKEAGINRSNASERIRKLRAKTGSATDTSVAMIAYLANKKFYDQKLALDMNKAQLLSPQERAILELLLEDLDNDEIKQRLGIKSKLQLLPTMYKLGVNSRTGLTIYAFNMFGKWQPKPQPERAEARIFTDEELLGILKELSAGAAEKEVYTALGLDTTKLKIQTDRLLTQLGARTKPHAVRRAIEMRKAGFRLGTDIQLTGEEIELAGDEDELAELISFGFKGEALENVLDKSETDIKMLRGSLLKKAGAKSETALVRRLFELGVLRPADEQQTQTMTKRWQENRMLNQGEQAYYDRAKKIAAQLFRSALGPMLAGEDGLDVVITGKDSKTGKPTHYKPADVILRALPSIGEDKSDEEHRLVAKALEEARLQYIEHKSGL